MFLIGDKVVHPMHGAGIIERITHERLGLSLIHISEPTRRS